MNILERYARIVYLFKEVRKGIGSSFFPDYLSLLQITALMPVNWVMHIAGKRRFSLSRRMKI